MPISPIHKIWPVMSIFKSLPRVNSVLDVGAGFGKFGVLLREHLDIRLQRYDKKDWKATIDAIEIWPEYITPLHKYIYDCIYIGNALTISEKIPSYDVIILVEVIEHMSKKDGEELLLNLFNKCNLGISMTFPNVLQENDRCNWPNYYEDHKSLWTFEDLSKLFNNVIPVGKLAYHIMKI